MRSKTENAKMSEASCPNSSGLLRDYTSRQIDFQNISLDPVLLDDNACKVVFSMHWGDVEGPMMETSVRINIFLSISGLHNGGSRLPFHLK